MTKSRSHQNESDMRYQYMKSGVDAVRSYLLSEIFGIEKKTADLLRKSSTSMEVDAFKWQIAENHKAVSYASRNINYVDGNSMAKILMADVDYYAKVMRMYAGALHDPEERGHRVSERFEKTIKCIDSITQEYLSRSIAMLHKKGLDTADLKNWSKEKKKDRFGFSAVRDSFREVLAAAKYSQKDESLWAERLTPLADKMNGIMRSNLARHMICLSAYASASAGLCDDAITDIRLLVEFYATDEAEHLLRKTQPENAGQEGFRNESQRDIFVERMFRGIEAFRAFVLAAASEKENNNYARLEELGMEKEMIDKLRALTAPTEMERREKAAISMALANPQDQASLDNVLRSVVRTDSMRYAACLISFSSQDKSRFKELMLKGIDEIRGLVVPKTVENTGSTIESLRGRVAEAELAKIADWFVRRSKEGFEFEKRVSAIDGMLSTKDPIEMIYSVGGEIAKFLFNYMLSLDACSNAASGRNVSALENLSTLMGIDTKNASFYATHSIIGNAQWN